MLWILGRISVFNGGIWLIEEDLPVAEEPVS